MAVKNTSVKKRHWAFVLYPESAPKDWHEQLKISGIQGAISPLHDKDIDPTGTPKKPHYHIILVYGSPTTFNNVKSLTDRLNQPIPIALEQVRGMYRYLTHKDNPEKYQYSDSDIITLNGFNIADFVEITKTEVTVIKKALQRLIREHNIDEYVKFMDIVIDNYDNNYYDVACNNTIFFNTYIKSLRYSRQDKITIDLKTGEVKGGGEIT